MREDTLKGLIDSHIPPESLEEQWDIAGLGHVLAQHFSGDWPIQQWLDEDHDLHEESLRARIHDIVAKRYEEKEALIGTPNMRQLEKAVMLQTLDSQWKDHLAAMDYLRQGIHLRGYAQKNPKQEYKREAFQMFSAMLDSIKQDVVVTLEKIQVQAPEDFVPSPVQEKAFEFKHEVFEGFGDGDTDDEEPGLGQGDSVRRVSGQPEHQPFVREGRKVGRNEPCPCGSGKKYKQCHGKAS